MKSFNIKILTLIGLVLAAAGGLSMKSINKERTLRVAFPVKLKATAYEPTNINLDHEYIFLENVFSPLVEISKDGSIEAGVAEKMDWLGDELKLTIRKSLKTASGMPITPDDVVFSLKRLLVLSGNTHGNFKDIVCPGVTLKTVEDDCPGIHKDSDSVYLNAKGRKSFLLPMLGAIDFAVIPRSSVDPKTLKIINFSETSGPYWLEKEEESGEAILKLNPHHYFASKDVAEKIVFVPTDTTKPDSSLKDLEENRVDHLTTIDASKADKIIRFAQKHPDFESHVTMKIRSLFIVFTERGRKELSADERRYIGDKMKGVFSSLYADIPGFEQRAEFFPSLGEGGLTQTQREKLESLRELKKSEPQKHFKIGIIKRTGYDEWATPIAAALPTADCYKETNVPDFKKYEKPDDVPHAWIASTDTGFMEDISLISYSLNAGLLGLSKQERSKWLANYMATDDKGSRISKLKELHYQALAEPAIVPLIASPYAALVRKPWKIELSDLYANNQLWRITLH
ncbi:MAG: hypothetical protein J0L82_18930 [Deltaproteobacteria bacterium]|jgi:MarR-like DNA-binding transcriptional regulator SgrR of sgrS sRNA|nr:hypothetical protein [Deltaproteobacteria bacterium]